MRDFEIHRRVKRKSRAKERTPASGSPLFPNRDFPGWVPGLCFALFLCLGAYILYTPPESAWEDPVSDATEYVMGARRLVTEGRYDVTLNGNVYPSRYQPGFPVFFLAPIYQIGEWIGSDQHGLGILAVFLATMISLAVFWTLARRILGGWAGVAAGTCILAALLQITSFCFYSRQIMSDIPALMLGLLGLLLFRRVFRESRTTDFFWAGVLTGIGVSVRITTLAICIPFGFLLLQRFPRLEWRKVFVLGLPILVALSGLLLYNDRTFGHPLVTGYRYWLPPDRYELALEHFLPNLYKLTNPFLPFLPPRASGQGVIGPVILTFAILLGVTCRFSCPRGWEQTRFAVIYLIFAALPIFIFHLFYPFYMSRFVLLFHCTVIFLGIVWSAMLCERLPRIIFIAIAIAAAFVAVESRGPPPYWQKHSQLDITKAVDRLLPEDAIFLSEMNPMYVELMLLAGTHRWLIPISKWGLFATWKIGVATRKRIFKFTALHKPNRIREQLKNGRRVFIHTTARTLSGPARKYFKENFRMEEIWREDEEGPSIAELRLSENTGD